MIRAGQLKHPFYVVNNTNNYGNPSDVDVSTSATVIRVEVLSQRAAAKIIGGGVLPANTLVFRARYLSTLTENQYLVHKHQATERYHIRAIENVDFAGREMLITVERR